MSFNPTMELVDEFIQKISEGYTHTYGNMKSSYNEILCWVATTALEIIANSDALYHNVENTILVTLTGMDILRGKHIKEGGVTPEDWLHFIISLVCQDIGYVKGMCSLDQPEKNIFAIGVDGKTIKLPSGSTDAALTPFHVDRSKLFIEERFRDHGIINVDIIKKNIELTRFPVPDTPEHSDTKGFPGLVRSADLIAQMADPRYLQRVASLFYEFQETGTADVLGYKTPGDLRKSYFRYYWRTVHKYVMDGLYYLAQTQDGKSIIASLYSNIFMVENSFQKTIMSSNFAFLLPDTDRPDRLREEKQRRVKYDSIGNKSVISSKSDSSELSSIKSEKIEANEDKITRSDIVIPEKGKTLFL